jgi:3-dehydroquinate dehydratase/shikimate dehydrogenase
MTDVTQRPRLCATVTANTMAELRARRDAVRGADLVELRLDTVADPDVAGALAGRRVPVILTCRTRLEGGAFAGAESERLALLAAAVGSDAEYVDLEWSTGVDDLVRARRGRGVVLSMHDFGGVPGDLADRARAMAGAGAEIVKIAVTAARLSDAVRLRDLGRDLPGGRVLIAMGEPGLVTRICAARFGNVWSYAGEGVAPGQLTVAQMAREYGFARVGADTALYGLWGRPLAHSLSPALHNAAFAALGTDAVYVPLAADSVEDLAGFARAFGLRGASVTAPFKTDVLRLAGAGEPGAPVPGAANTVRWTADGVEYRNTDVEGFLAPLAGETFGGRRVAVLGNGGSARAVAAALAPLGARVTLYGRDAARARAVASDLGVAGAGRPVPAGSWDVLVNATPVGTQPDGAVSACPEARFDGGLVFDLVYNPPQTALLRAARAAGCRTIGGLDMLIAQARLQQEFWTGILPPDAPMREAAAWKLSTWTSTL